MDPQLQHLSLQLIYAKRLLNTKTTDDFVSPLIGAGICMYTGHKSFIPWFQYPSIFVKLFKTLPIMLVLSDLLKALPPLRCHKSWSGLWLMDTPLRVAVNNSTYQTDAQSTATVVAKKNLASSFSIRCNRMVYHC